MDITDENLKDTNIKINGNRGITLNYKHFNTPSRAASYVLGGKSADGWREWKIADGKYKDKNLDAYRTAK